MKTIIHATTIRNWKGGICLSLLFTTLSAGAFTDLTGQAALQAPDPEANDNRGKSLGTASLTTAASAQSPSQPSESIPLSELGAKAGAQYQGDGLSVMATPEGASLRCVFQKLEGLVTHEGLWLTSTVEVQAGEKFCVKARAVGREGELKALPPLGAVSVADKFARFVRPGLTEEYFVSVDGVRQDFVVSLRPEGAGALRVELEVTGAKAEALVNGARLVLDGSGRRISYSRLHVMDAEGRELKARMEVTAETSLSVLVDDAAATYPVRIDPTFSDADWISLGGVPGANGVVYATVVDGSGNLYIGGDFSAVGEVFTRGVAKWNGSTWSALGSGVSGTVYALAVSGIDVYVGGGFYAAGDTNAANIAKWNGSAWSTMGLPSDFGVGVDSRVNALAVLGSDLYVGGNFTVANYGSVSPITVNGIAKWNGSLWSAMGTGVELPGYTGSVSAMAVSGSDLYVGGLFSIVDGTSANGVAKWNGSTWLALGSGVEGTGFFGAAYSLAVSGSDVYVGGQFSTAGGIGATNVAKWNGSTWSALGPSLNSTVYGLAVSGGDLYAGGAFNSTALVLTPLSYVAKWNGSTWSALGAGVNTVVYTLAASGGNLYAGGNFTFTGNTNLSRVGKWNGSAWVPVAAGLNNDVKALAFLGSDLYVGGLFTTAGSTNANFVAKWNGTTWSALGSGMNTVVYSLATLGSDLYAGGNFTTAGGNSAARVAKWNGSAWSAVGSGFNGAVLALTASGSDLYAGGLFNYDSLSSTNFNYVAKWTGSAWSALGPGVGGTVNALALSDGGLFPLYAGGNFFTAGGSSATNVAKWNGSTWSALGSGVNGGVLALTVSSNDLYVGGTFSAAGSISASRIAKWNGSAWSALGLGVGGSTVYALATLGTDLYVGGSFTTAGGNTANNVAKWDGNEWSALGSGIGVVPGAKVSALKVLGTNLFVSGFFSTAGDKAAGSMAMANISFPTPPPPPTPPVINVITVDIGLVFLECVGTPDLFYEIERADDGTGSSWNVIDTQQAAIDGSFYSADYNPPATAAFYRLRQQ